MSDVAKLIERVRELDAAATPRPWGIETDCMDVEEGLEMQVTTFHGLPGRDLLVRVIPYDVIPVGQTQRLLETQAAKDATAIAEYRALAPKLADMLERALTALQAIADEDYEDYREVCGAPCVGHKCLACFADDCLSKLRSMAEGSEP